MIEAKVGTRVGIADNGIHKCTRKNDVFCGLIVSVSKTHFDVRFDSGGGSTSPLSYPLALRSERYFTYCMRKKKPDPMMRYANCV